MKCNNYQARERQTLTNQLLNVFAESKWGWAVFAQKL